MEMGRVYCLIVAAAAVLKVKGKKYRRKMEMGRGSAGITSGKFSNSSSMPQADFRFLYHSKILPLPYHCRTPWEKKEFLQYSEAGEEGKEGFPLPFEECEEGEESCPQHFEEDINRDCQIAIRDHCSFSAAEIIQEIKGAKVATVIFFNRDDCPFSSAAENFSLGRNGRDILTAAGNKMMPNFSTVLSPPLSSFCTAGRRSSHIHIMKSHHSPEVERMDAQVNKD
ncbi:Uncharacterized protein Fot_52471 [Forsythia ovata]|uniref:Uncharacterized protein n=1 Tax=Forsythia ovata TaxID=205694 RepID=A0ABD1PKT5_9LAMI